MYTERHAHIAPPAPVLSESDGLPVEHLQLRTLVTFELRNRDVLTVADARRFMLLPEIDRFAYGAELAEAVCQLESCRIDGEADWARYWQARGFSFHYLCAWLPPLGRLSERARTHRVNRDCLGLAGMRLAGLGYADLGTLTDALREGIKVPPGMGRTKLEDFYQRLIRLSDEVDEHGELNGLDLHAGEHPSRPAWVPAIIEQIPANVASLPVDVLCIGAKCPLIRNAGFRTIGDLVSVDPAVLAAIPSVGKPTVRLALDRADQLATAVIDGEVDWPAWCSATGLPLVPEHPVESGRELLQLLPSILDRIGASVEDPVVRDIVSLRLMAPPRDQVPLDEIAASHPRSNGKTVSRQRIQQMEAHLLRQLTGGLVQGRDRGLNICFHPDFVGWWKRMAEPFAGDDELSVDDFLARLALVWDVTVAELIPHIPTICSIVTGSSRLPSELRSAVRLRPQLYELGEESLAQPVYRFRFGKRGEQLERDGITSLSGILDLAKSGHCPSNILEHLDVIAECAVGGEISWPRYRQALGLSILPAALPQNRAEFSKHFALTIRQMLEVSPPTARMVQIYWLRTRQPENIRPTLEAVASQLGTYSSSIKKEETELLQWLHRTLVDGRQARLPFWIDDEWLTIFREAAAIFDECDEDFEHFGVALAVRWNLTLRDLNQALPSLWAILTGYPVGRRYSGRNARTATMVHPPARIQLRGFRTTH